MELKITRLEEKAIVPSIEQNWLNLQCYDILTEVGKDNRLVLIYRTGIAIEIPTGYIGLIVPTRLAPIYSLDDAAGVQILNQGYSGEIIARYKVNTNGVPAIFEQKEEFARLLIVPVESTLTMNLVELEVKQEEITESNDESNDVAGTEPVAETNE